MAPEEEENLTKKLSQKGSKSPKLTRSISDLTVDSEDEDLTKIMITQYSIKQL